MPHPLRDEADAIRVIDDALTTRTRLVIVDHVTSETALVLPLARIAQRCRERGVLVLADGAHAPGAVALDIESLDVDFYAANLHKWAWAPRSCGILWAAPRHHTWLHPPVISWGLYQGFTAEFDWVGTRDPTPALTAPTALALMDEFGADRVRAYNHHLAWTAACWLSHHWDTPFETPEAMIGVMATVPLPESAGSTAEDAARLRDRLLFDDHIEAQIHAGRGRIWVRLSAQIYIEMADVERLARAIDARVR
jgi:isopenicillin-N epimerase